MKKALTISPAIRYHSRMTLKPHPTRGRTLPSETLTSTEIASILAACSRECSTGIRNRAILITLWRGGLRISEALALCPRDIDLDRGVLSILRGKGNKQRQIPIDRDAIAAIKVWLARRQRIPGVNGGPVFCTLAGKRIQTAYIRQLLPRLARKAGVDRRVHAHQFRHSFATELLHERVPLTMIQRVLGHSNLAVTSRYLNHVTTPEIIEVMTKREWPEAVAR